MIIVMYITLLSAVMLTAGMHYLSILETRQHRQAIMHLCEIVANAEYQRSIHTAAYDEYMRSPLQPNIGMSHTAEMMPEGFLEFIKVAA
jgi:hypothetical protein